METLLDDMHTNTNLNENLFNVADRLGGSITLDSLAHLWMDYSVECAPEISGRLLSSQPVSSALQTCPSIHLTPHLMDLWLKKNIREKLLPLARCA